MTDEATSYLGTITLTDCVPDTLTMTNSRGEAVFTITPDGMLSLGSGYKENPDAAAQEFIRIVMEMMPKAFVDRVHVGEARAQLIDNDERTTVRIFTPYAPQKDESHE